MDERSPRKLLDTLFRRRRILGCVRDRPREKRALVEQLDVSRSTVDRGVRDLESLGLVTRDGGTLAATLPGRLCLDFLDDVETDLEALLEAAPLLRSLPSDAPMDRRLFRGADVHPAGGPAPGEPLSHAADLIRSADRFWGLATALTQPRFPQLLYRRVVDENLAARVVFERDLVDEVLAEQVDVLREMVAEGFRLFSAPAVPYGLLIGDTTEGFRAVLAIYDEDRTLEGVVVNDAPGAVAAAARLYQYHRRQAVEITDAVDP